MSTDTVRPLRQRMIEDMNARRLCTRRGATSAVASGSLHSNGLPERRRLRNLHVGVTGPEPPFLLTPVATHQG